LSISIPQRRVGGVDVQLQLFLISALDGQVSGQQSAPAALPRKRASLNRKMDVRQRRSGDSGEEKTLASPGIRTLNRLPHALITIPITLFRFPL
jgi:hypothetical protein